MQFAIFAGLGNQLFQYTAARFALQKTDQTLTFVIDQSPQLDRPFLLAQLIQNCTVHTRTRVAEIRETKARGKILYVLELPLLRPLARLFKILPIKYEMNPYNFGRDQFENLKLNVGYYQHWKYPENVWNIMHSEIEATISNIKLDQKLLKAIKNSIVIHIRRGDLVESRETMGLLSPDYYKEAIKHLTSPHGGNEVIAFTDDLVGAKDLAETLQVKMLLGPENIKQWEALALMSQAKRLVIANSTFSWWAGFLATKNQGRVLIPDPWFKNWHQNIGDAFQHPEMQIIESRFL